MVIMPTGSPSRMSGPPVTPQAASVAMRAIVIAGFDNCFSNVPSSLFQADLERMIFKVWQKKLP